MLGKLKNCLLLLRQNFFAWVHFFHSYYCNNNTTSTQSAALLYDLMHFKICRVSQVKLSKLTASVYPVKSRFLKHISLPHYDVICLLIQLLWKGPPNNWRGLLIPPSLASGKNPNALSHQTHCKSWQLSRAITNSYKYASKRIIQKSFFCDKFIIKSDNCIKTSNLNY